MKVGDTFPVTIEGHEVTQAKVVAMADGQVELVFQGKRAVMAYKTELAPPSYEESSATQHVMLGLDEDNAATPPVPAPVTPVEGVENATPTTPVVNNPTAVPDGPGEASDS